GADRDAARGGVPEDDRDARARRDARAGERARDRGDRLGGLRRVGDLSARQREAREERGGEEQGGQAKEVHARGDAARPRTCKARLVDLSSSRGMTTESSQLERTASRNSR